MLGIDRLGVLGASSTASAARPGSTCRARSPGIVPTNQWKQDALGAPIFPGETYQAGIGQGYDVVTPIQLDQRLRGAGQRRHALPAPDRARHRRPGRHRSSARSSRRSSTRWTSRRASSRRCATPPATSSTLRHTYNLVDLPIKVAGKSGTAEFGTRDTQGPAAVPLLVRRVRAQGPRNGSFDKPDSELVVLAFAYDSRTKGNVATEIVKYYLQLHYGIKKDYRLPDLLERGNFYQSN